VLRKVELLTKEHKTILALHRAETKTLLALARSMRLTPLSNRTSNDGRDPGRHTPRPWELEPEPA
jgi:hypothetical protein